MKTKGRNLSRQLTAVSDDASLLGLVVGTGGGTLDSGDDVHTLNDTAEDDVLVVQPGGLDSADEELRSVGAGASVGHGQNTGAGVLLTEVLVLEFGAVDGLTASSVTAGEVTTLDHELGDDPVEGRALVVEGLAGATGTLLTSAQAPEVLGGLGDNVVVQLHDHTALGLATNGDVEENSGPTHFDVVSFSSRKESNKKERENNK